jgi:hypothetical protein
MAKEVTSFRSQPEDFGPSEFSAILAEQKKQKLKEKDAIANTAVEFLAKKRLDLGYTSDRLKSENIGRTAVNVVTRFSDDLDSLRDVENYDELAEFVKLQDKVTKEYKKALADAKGGKGGGRFGELNANELGYIVKHLEPVTNELKKAAGTAQRFRFKVDEVKSAFKPAKIIDRLFGSDEGFIGKRIRAAIKRQEEAEKQVAGAQRGAVGEKFRAKVERIEEKAEGDDFTGDMGEGIPKVTPMEEVAQPVSKTAGKGAAERERRKELAEQKENITEENQSIFQAIADNTELTVLYLEDLIDLQKEQIKATEESGGGGGMGLPLIGGGKGKGSKPKGKGGFFKRMASKGKGLLGRAGAVAGRVAPIAARALPFLGPIGAVVGAGALAYSAFKFFKKKMKDKDDKELELLKAGVLHFTDSKGYKGQYSNMIDDMDVPEQPRLGKPGEHTEANREYLQSIGEQPYNEDELNEFRKKEGMAYFADIKSDKEIDMDEASKNIESLKGRRKLNAEKMFRSKFGMTYDQYKKGETGGVGEIEFGLATGQLTQGADGSISGFVKGYDGPTGESTKKLMEVAKERDLTQSDFPIQPINNIVNAPVNSQSSTQNVMDASATNRDNTFSVAFASAEF